MISKLKISKMVAQIRKTELVWFKGTNKINGHIIKTITLYLRYVGENKMIQ